MVPEITLEQVLELHQYSIERFGGAVGIRDKEALLSAVERPYGAFGGEAFYVNAFARAAAIGESIVMNHPFVDGNKRTGLLLMDLLLKMEGYTVHFTFNEGYQFVIDIATGNKRFDEIVEWLNLHSVLD